MYVWIYWEVFLWVNDKQQQSHLSPPTTQVSGHMASYCGSNWRFGAFRLCENKKQQRFCVAACRHLSHLENLGFVSSAKQTGMRTQPEDECVQNRCRNERCRSEPAAAAFSFHLLQNVSGCLWNPAAFEQEQPYGGVLGFDRDNEQKTNFRLELLSCRSNSNSAPFLHVTAAFHKSLVS